MRSRPILGLFVLSLTLFGCVSRGTDCPACQVGNQADTYPCDASGGNPFFTTASTGELDLLFLSGGGSFGAFGAGLLYGWSNAGTLVRPRPTFNVVTGISTGALQATAVFLGSGHDPALYASFTQSVSDLMKPRPWWQQPFASSVNTTKGLKDRLVEIVPDTMIDAVAGEYGKRLLCVGTTDLDTGRFVSWDLTRVARDHAYELYRALLLASASVPAASPPVEIAGALHGDGGVRHQIYPVAPLLTQLRTGRENISDRVYVLANEHLTVKAACPDPRTLRLADRAIRILLTEGLVSDVRGAEAIGGTVPGADKVSLYLVAIPNSYPLNITNADFDPDEMCRLFCRGSAAGKQFEWSGTPWSLPDDPRSCLAPSYPPGDTLDDSDCPPYGPPQCPPDSVYP